MTTRLQIPQLKAPPGYRPQAIDTCVEADLLDFYLLRQRSVTERVALAASLIDSACELSLHFLSRQFAHLTHQQFARKLAEAWLQKDCPPHYIPKGSKKGSQMTWIQNSIELATQLHDVFVAADIPYYITGGVAAIAYGDPRTTRDLDAVIRVPLTAIATLQTTLEQAGFYVAGADDVASGHMTTLQITHMESISRAGLMVAEDSPYALRQFDRRRLYPFPSQTEVYLAAPEDLIISKIRWQSESEKQRRDVLAILKVQQAALGYRYLYRWGAEFELIDVLDELIVAAGVGEIVSEQLAGSE